MTDPTRCDSCGMPGDDRAAVSDDDQEWGFCSQVCMVLFVAEKYAEVWALAASPSPGRRSAVDGRGGDAGGTQGDRRLQGSRAVQAPPTSEAGA